MTSARILFLFGVVSLMLIGGCQKRDDNTGAENLPATTSVSTVGFLLFPNPQLQADGTVQTDTTAYAQAYYAAIDPTNAKDTLAKWMSVNGFGSGTGTEFTVIFRDVHDLGYGRRMTARRNGGNVAVMVENYQVTAIPGQQYGPLNLEAAIARDSQWHAGTNTIEFSLAPNNQIFAKFFSFSPTTGQRQLTANLDGFGQKAMPGICISCHGGRADPLEANGTFPSGGNVRARLQPLNVGSFDYSTQPGFTRADQEANLKLLNQFVLCTYPLQAGTANPEDACRPLYNGAVNTPTSSAEWFNRWQSTAAEMLKSWYGGAGMPSSTFSDTYLPAGWAGQAALYNNVVAPYCRTCHVVRGTGNQNEIDFMSFAKFQNYGDRIKVHVFDRGNMPLAFLPSQRFWDSTAPDTLATFLEGLGLGFTLHAGGTVLRPGRPIADAGISRSVKPGSVVLSGANSLFTNRYTWSIVSGTGSLTNANTVTPTFTSAGNGATVIQLVVGNGTVSSAPAQITLTVDNTIVLAPSAIRFRHIHDTFSTFAVNCTVCHDDGSSSGAGGTPPWESTSGTPPIFYTDYDRGLGATTVGSAGDGTYTPDSTDDDFWFYTQLRGRINLTDPAASLLLLKPTGNHHGGGQQLLTTDPEYSLFVNWILNGAPY